MGLFDNMLKSDESLFRNEVALDFDFLPKNLPFRENEQKRFAEAVKPLLAGRNGRNVFTYGAPGIGKTAACKFVLRELEEETADVMAVYLNCWKQNTTYKILVEMCNQLGIGFIANKKSIEIMEILKRKLNKGSCVVVFDEVDKLESADFLYMMLEEIYRKSIILITNYKEKISEMDERILSRLNPETLMFREYNREETLKILKDRMSYAFADDVWDTGAFQKIADISYGNRDIRKGLHLMREAGNLAEERMSKKVEMKHVEMALSKMPNYSKVSLDDFDDEAKMILGLIKDNHRGKISDVFRKYQEKGGVSCYKTFSRKVEQLRKGSLIEIESSDEKGKPKLLSSKL